MKPIIELLRSFTLDVWVYRGADWFVHRPQGPARRPRGLDRASSSPPSSQSFDGLTDDVAKLVGVSDDHDAVAAGVGRPRTTSSATTCRRRASQPYYVDVTHPDANKGGVAKYLSAKYEIPTEQIATIGDMPNDVLMFAHSGLSIAMGNAEPEVQRAARAGHDVERRRGLRERGRAVHAWRMT